MATTTGGLGSNGAIKGMINPQPFKSGVSPTGQSISSQGQNTPAPVGSFYSGGAHPVATGPVTKQVSIDQNGARNETHFGDATPATKTGITAGAGYKVDPNNPNGVVADKPEAPTPSTGTGDNPGMINVGGTPAAQPTPTTQSGFIQGAANAAAGNQALGQQGIDTAAQYGANYARVGKEGAGLMAGQLTTGTSPVAEGNAAITAQTIAAQQSALAAGGQLAEKGIGQALTAQQQQQSGMLGAAEKAAPTTGVAYGTQVYNPMTGKMEGGSGMDTAMAQYAQGLATNSLSAKDIPSSITNNPVLAAQLQQMAKTINPAYNPTQQSAQTASIGDLTTQKSQIQSIANGAEANYKLLLNTATAGGVNDTKVPILNTLENNLKMGLTSSEAVTNFRSTLAQVRSAYASILGGGTATDMSRGIANDQIPDSVSLGALQSLGEQLKAEANNRTNGIDDQIKKLQGTGTSSSGSTGSTSGTFSTGGSWKFVNGQYVKA